MKFNPSMIDSLTNFTPATWTMIVLASGTEDITLTTSLSLTSLSQAVSNPSYTNQLLVYSICNNNLQTTLNNFNYEE